jgi:hypothetical protein
MTAKRSVPTRIRNWLLNDGRTVAGCRDLGCYSATFGAFCTTCAKALQPKEGSR